MEEDRYAAASLGRPATSWPGTAAALGRWTKRQTLRDQRSEGLAGTPGKKSSHVPAQRQQAVVPRPSGAAGLSPSRRSGAVALPSSKRSGRPTSHVPRLPRPTSERSGSPSGAVFRAERPSHVLAKRSFFPLCLLFLFSLVLPPQAQARNWEVIRKASDYTVRIVVDPYPPLATGDNHLEIEITDKDAKAVSDAKVMINYYMPPMPRMPPMNYRTTAAVKKGKYYATMKFIMAGPWYISIIIDHGGRISTAKINVDAQ